MKTNVTLSFKIFFLLCILSGMHSFAQPDYSFKNPKLISGMALQQCAVYKYSNVKTGVNAIMTLGFISPGVVVADFKKFNYNNSILALKIPKPKVSQVTTAVHSSFEVYPSLINNSAKISVNASKDGWAVFELIDYSVRRFSQQQIFVDKSANNIPIFNLYAVATEITWLLLNPLPCL